MTLDARLVRIISELVDAGIPYWTAREQFEQKYLKVALATTEGNITRAAQKIGMHRNSLMIKVPLAERRRFRK